MANRTTPTDVRKVLLSGVREGDDLEPFIDVANQLVNDWCTTSGYDDIKLELIERWLAAHCYALDIRRIHAQGVGSGAVTQNKDKPKVDLGLRNTVYGQTAVRIDKAGNLAGMDNAMDDIKVTLGAGGIRSVWLGTDPCRCR